MLETPLPCHNNVNDGLIDGKLPAPERMPQSRLQTHPLYRVVAEDGSENKEDVRADNIPVRVDKLRHADIQFYGTGQVLGCDG